MNENDVRVMLERWFPSVPEGAVAEVLEAVNHNRASNKKALLVDFRTPDVVCSHLKGIADQCGKEQFWNAINRTHELQGFLLVSFGYVLKGKKD